MGKKTDIYFNDVLVARTDRPVTYERDSDGQKEYRFTNTKSLLSAIIFCDEIEIIPNDNITVEIF